jgi:hypothetical protein
MKINALCGELPKCCDMDWQPIATAPYDCDLELAVIDRAGTHALVFACRRIPAGWLKSKTNQWVDVHPTHWRAWTIDRSLSGPHPV